MKNSGRIILGIDPGYGRVGFGAIVQARHSLSCLSFGCIEPQRGPLAQRLAFIFETLTKLLDELRPDLVAIEQLFFFKNITTAIDVAQARGVIVLAAQHQKCPIIECTPLQIKGALTGNGRAEKRQVQRMVGMLLGLKRLPSPDDASDALAAAITASQLLKNKK